MITIGHESPNTMWES